MMKGDVKSMGKGVKGSMGSMGSRSFVYKLTGLQDF
jgi:hypothetical protein